MDLPLLQIQAGPPGHALQSAHLPLRHQPADHGGDLLRHVDGWTLQEVHRQGPHPENSSDRLQQLFTIHISKES